MHEIADKMDKITYEEAGNFLHVKKGTIEHAVSRGDLTPVGKRERFRYLVKGQVLLFQGKKRISKFSLTREELDMWEKYRDEALVPSTITTEHLSPFPKIYLDPEVSRNMLQEFLKTGNIELVARGSL